MVQVEDSKEGWCTFILLTFFLQGSKRRNQFREQAVQIHSFVVIRKMLLPPHKKWLSTFIWKVKVERCKIWEICVELWQDDSSLSFGSRFLHILFRMIEWTRTNLNQTELPSYKIRLITINPKGICRSIGTHTKEKRVNKP